MANKAASPQAVTLAYEPTQKDLEAMTETVTNEIKKDVQEQVKDEIKKEVLDETKKEIQSAAAPEWTKRIRFSGDIRLRYEGDFFSKNNGEFLNPASPTQILNSQTEQDRFRVRARLGASTDLPDNLEAGVRFTTGDPANPVTTQQTMGNYFNNYQVVMDLAYLKFTPNPDFTFIGGRFKNPFFATDLIWWRDLSFDGFSGTYQAKLSDAFQPFFTVGAFPLQDISLSTDDKYLFAGQAGIDINPHKNLSGKLGVAFYDYQHAQGTANNPAFPDEYDYTAPVYEQKGNTLFDIQPSTSTPIYALAANYHGLNVTGIFDIAFWNPVHVILTGDYVNNLGFSRSSVERLTGVPDIPSQTQGYLAGLTVGYPEINKRWDWRVYGYYKYLEADAVLDAFTDPDFHLGGTNAKGWALGGDLGLGKNLWASLKWVTTNEIKGPPFGIDSLFVDLNYRYLGGDVKKKILIGALGLIVGLGSGLIYGHVQLDNAQKVHQAKLKEMTQRLSQTQRRYLEERTLHTSVEDDKQAIQSRLDALEKEKETLASQNKELKTKTEALDAKATALDKKASSLETRASSLDAKNSQLTERLTKVEAERSALDKKEKTTSFTLQEREKELKQLSADSHKQYEQCAAHNVRLYEIADDLIRKYDDKGFVKTLLSKEPFTQNQESRDREARAGLQGQDQRTETRAEIKECLMRSARIIVAFAVFLSVSLPLFGAETKIAVVNGVDVPVNDFWLELLKVERTILNAGHPLTTLQVTRLKTEVAEALVKRELLYQESKTRVKVTEGEINIDSRSSKTSTRRRATSRLPYLP